MTRKIYVAGSWKNVEAILEIVKTLREDGHEVYDFTAPEAAFTWDTIDPAYRMWNALEFMGALELEQSRKAYMSDRRALDWCDTLVLVAPCGNDAHLEAGYAIGGGKVVHILLNKENFRPGLMYKLAAYIHPDLAHLRRVLGS